MTDAAESMMDRKSTLKVLLAIGSIITVLLSISAATKAWVILPYRIELHEAAISALRADNREVSLELRTQREILIRIEEQLKLQRRINP